MKVIKLRLVDLLGSLGRGLTTWCSPHMKAMTVLKYWNHSKKGMFKTCRYIRISHSDALSKRFYSIILFGSLIILNVLFCGRQQKNFLFMKKHNYGTRLKMAVHFWLSGVVDEVTTYCLQLHYTYWFSTRLSPSSVNFLWNILIVLLLLYSKNLCKVYYGYCDFRRISS